MEETPDCILQCSDIVKERKKVKLTIVFPKFFLLVIQFRIWVIIRAEFIFRCSEVQQSSQAVQKKPPPYNNNKPKEKPHRLQSKFRNQKNRKTISTP
jgi:hypothetical protein